MIEKYYSKIDTNKVLHLIHRLNEDYGRVNLVPEDEYIQCSFLKFKNEQTFKAHKHIFKNRHYPNKIAQESWIVIKGKS